MGRYQRNCCNRFCGLPDFKKKETGQAGMNKKQKIIVLAAIGLIVIAFLFPPYKECPINEKGEYVGTCYIQWEFNRDLRRMIDGFRRISLSSSRLQFGLMDIYDPIMHRLLYGEILVILVLAGAALIITKER